MPSKVAKPPPIANSVERTVAQLRDFYELGRSANETGGGYGEKTSQQYAEQFGISKARVDHARTFARRVDCAEFELICAMRDCHGKALGPGLATVLATVENRALRTRLLSLWAKNGWTVVQLKAAVGHKLSKRSQGGRKLKLPSTKLDAIQQLQQLSRRWLDLYAGLEQPPDESVVSLTCLTAAVRRKLQTAAQVLTEVRASLDRELEK